ncbi:hypothetical protein BU15DRAFT_72096 [Melanogaster broomeanus]|nr:hypothetical protein BU15DRAFT_72096 [Melanogaster broomeanus]
MTTPPTPQPSPWRPDTNYNPLVYTRPLVSSELLMHNFAKANAGQPLRSIHPSLSQKSVPVPETPSRDYGTSLESSGWLLAVTNVYYYQFPLSPDSVYRRYVMYTPVQDDSDREGWLQRAFVFEDKGHSLDLDGLVSSLKQICLPYHVDGRSVFFRCYLVAGSESNYALLLYGSHAIMDGWTALNGLSLMFGWMSADAPPGKLEWGSEWKNLPPDPITATRGPCATWNTDGARLFEEIATNGSRQVTCLRLGDDHMPTHSYSPGNHIKILHRFTESESREIATVARQNECTVSHLLEAAHCLALAACNPPNVGADSAGEVDFGAEMTIASLEPVLSKTHFVSAYVHLPIRIQMTEILKSNSKVHQMQLTMKALKEQYQHYLDNPCIYHLLAAQESSPTPFRTPQFNSRFTNIGVTEKRLQRNWTGQGGESLFEIDGISIVNRITTSMVMLHSWSFGDALYFQLNTSDIWKDAEGDDTIMQRFFDEIIRHVRILLPLVSKV